MIVLFIVWLVTVIVLNSLGKHLIKLLYNYISHYYKKSSITMLIILFTLFSFANAQLSQLNIFIAVQNQDQTYLSVLPYIDTCYYNHIDIIPGAATVSPLSLTKIFEAVTLESVIAFWAPVTNGMDIALVFAYSITNYTGYILYNSALQNFNRQVIIYDIIGQKLIFNYVLPTINSQTLQLTLTIVDFINIDLPTFAQTILSQCSQFNSTISFLGNKTFLYLCSSSQSGFTFIPKDANSVFLVNTSKLQLGSYNLTTNPEQLNSFTQFLAFPYNSILLITNQEDSYLYFVLLENQTLDFVPIVALQEQFMILIDRIWGQEFNLQIPKWMDIYKTLSSVDGLFFPGDIVSVYVNQQEDIFIESQSITEPGLTYLSALNNIGNVYWNFSFYGQVFLYSSQIVFIYSQQNQTISTLQIQRPIYRINVSNFQNTTPSTFYNFSLNISCYYTNITINYRILWTTPEYPSAYAFQLCDTYLTSNSAIFGLLVSQNYLIVGPDLKIVPETPNNIVVFTIDQTTTVINNSVVGFVGVWSESDGTFQIILATNTTIYEITYKNQLSVLAVNPCGFYVITSAVKISANLIMISNENNQSCICNLNFTQCQIENITSKLKTINNSLISSIPNYFAFLFNSFDGVLFKKNLYALIKQGYIISILQNNSAVLVNIVDKVILDIVELNCSSNNSTNGFIYNAQFQSPVLILFCQGSPQLFQYLINNNTFKINRVIPLYAFNARPGQISLQLAQSYAFLEVDPINLFVPQIQNCCVLKLNFSDFTISVIAQVIYAKSVIAYGFEGSYNFVVLSSNISELGPQTIVTIYFMNEWITFNQTDHFDVVDENISVSINFYSFTFNFAVQTQFYLTFNLTNQNLNINLPKTNKTHQIQQPTINFSPSDTTGEYNLVFNATVNYNLSEYVCGPVFHNFFIKNTSDLLIYQRDILIPSKMIGKIGRDDYIQIMNPQDWQQQNFSMNNLLLIVGTEVMYVYAKMLNNVQIVNIANITLSERQCQYYLYNVINQTAVTLNSQCSGFNTSQYNPYLIINYDPINSLVTYFISESISRIQLRNTFTFPGSEQTLIVGILEGPLSSQSGRLVLCSISNCSYMFISNSFSFLLDFSALQIDNNTFYITVLDTITISVFISPEIQPPNATVNPNFIFNYDKTIDDPYCSVIKIINATQTNSYVILSCTQYYYLMILDFANQEISVVQKFSRYCNCALYDNFRPQIIKSNEGALVMFITQCRIDDLILKIKVYEGISNKTLPVHTGYLQIFTLSGPLGPNCSEDSISPTKIVTLECSMDKQLIKIYTIGQTNKFMYPQINGILIDNFIEQLPQVQLTYRPESQIITFPTIQFVVTNQFHTVQQSIQTGQLPVLSVSILDYVIFIMYISANLVNLFFIICFFIQRKSMEERIRLQNLIERQKNEDLSESDEKNNNNFELFSRSLTQTIKNVSSSMQSKSKPKSKSLQMELYFFKKPKRFQ